MIKETIKDMFFTRDMNWFSVIGIITAYEVLQTSVWYALLVLFAFAITNLIIEARLD